MNDTAKPIILPHLRDQMFRELIEAGMTQQECLKLASKHFGGPDPITAKVAHSHANTTDDLSTDPTAYQLISPGEDGCWVSAWMLVAPADMDKAWTGKRDTSEKPCRFLNHYSCECGETWTSAWSCMVDDECAACGKSISPDEEETTFDGPDWLRDIWSE